MTRLPPCSFAILVLALGASAARAQDPTSRPVTGAIITLDDAIRIALEQNATVRFARNSQSLDSLTVRQLRNQFLPNLNVSSQSSQGFGSRQSGQNTFGTNLGVSSGITLYNGRQNVNALREAELNVRAAGHDLGRARQTIVFTVASDFLNLITQQEQSRVQQENLVAQEEQLRQLEAFARQGTRPIGDLYQQQAATASARLAVVTTRRAMEMAKVDLIQELVLNPRGNYTFETPAPQADTTRRPNLNLDSLMDIALQRRVDIQAQLLRVEAAQREIMVADGGRLPVITGSASYGSGFTSGGSDNIAVQLDQRRGGSIGVGVGLPIFDRGAASIARQRAQIQLENEGLILRDETQTVALEVRRAFLDYQSAQEQLTAADAQQKAAALALEAAQARYRVGLATFVEVTLARATLVQAQSAVVNARASLVFQRALMAYYTGEIDAGRLDIFR
ncbi:MAG: TolC family protein [bacterium]